MAICFIGNSIIDFISHVENEENIAHGTKGEMEIISSKKAKELINNLKTKYNNYIKNYLTSRLDKKANFEIITSLIKN